jgi:hypothetical protein
MVQFDVEAALRQYVVRQLTDKLAATVFDILFRGRSGKAKILPL